MTKTQNLLLNAPSNKNLLNMNFSQTDLYLEVGAKRGKDDSMTGELLPSAAQGDITEGIVKP